MAKTPKALIEPDRLKTISFVIRIVIITIIVVNTVVAIIIYISSMRAIVPAEPATSAAHRELDEFADNDSRLAYAASLLDQNMYQSAEAFLSEFLSAVEPDSQIAAAICYDLGLAHLYLKKYDQAVSDLSAVIAKVGYPDAYYNLGNALVGLKDYEKALEAYETAIQLEQKPEYIVGRDAVLALMDKVS